MKDTSPQLSVSATPAGTSLFSAASQPLNSQAAGHAVDVELAAGSAEASQDGYGGEQDEEPGVADFSQGAIAHTHIRPGSGWFDWKVREMWRFRDLLLALASRDVKLRYRQTALGIVWVVMQPLLGAGVLSFIFGKVARLSSGQTPYFVFVFCGFLGWNAFSTLVTRSSNAVLGHSSLVTKIYFPRLLLPLSTAFSVLLDFGVSFLVLLVLLVAYRITPWIGILWLPVWLFILMLFALGIGSVAAALLVRYRDVAHILPVVLNLLLYASAVAFPLDEAYRNVPARFHFVFTLNPITGLIEAMRWSILGTGLLQAGVLSYSIACSIVVFAFGVTFFRRLERHFPDII
jgi:lipopolysaccharide transport system permease protein